MTRYPVHATLQLALLLSAPATWAQDDILFFGTIRKHEVKEPLPGAKVLVVEDSLNSRTVVADSLGRYSFTVYYGKVVEVEYRYPGRVSKRVLVDGRGVPRGANWGAGFGMNIEIRLNEPVDTLDLGFLQEPIGRAAYSKRKRNMAWDMEYTAPRVARYKALFPDRYPETYDPVPAHVR